MLPTWMVKFTSLIALLGFLPYIISIVKGKTSPARMTWIIWLVLMISLSVSMYSAGDREVFWLYIGYAVGDVIVVLLAIKHGHGGWTTIDRLCLFLVGISLITLWVLRSPEAGLVCLVVAGMIGFIPTAMKVYVRPASEDVTAWLVWLLSDVLCLLTITQWSFSIVVYPVTSFLKCGLVVGRVITARKREWRMSTERRKTRIESVEDLEKVRARIGEQNFQGVQRALADGASVWVFLAKEEIEQDPDLSPQEKSECSVILEREGYAGWLRQRKQDPPYIPGITVHPSYDSHGNYHGGGGSSEGARH